MLFDKMCGIAERHYPPLKSVLDNARLFKFEGVPHEILNDMMSDYTDEEVKEVYDSFHLPYDCVAVEDGASCIMISDIEDNQIGLGSDRFFAEIIRVDNKDTNYFNDAAYGFQAFKQALIDTNKIDSDLYVIVFGKGYMPNIYDKTTMKSIVGDECMRKDLEIYLDEHANIESTSRLGFTVDGHLIKILFGSKKKGIVVKSVKEFFDANGNKNTDMENKILETRLFGQFMRNVSTAYEELIYFNSPTRFILKETKILKKKPKSNKNKNHIRRSNERPIYTVLKPEEIRRRLNLPTGYTGKSHSSPRPHERRRHFRFLSSDRYRYNEKGEELPRKIIPYGDRKGEEYYKKIDIPATWIGPSEAVVGSHRYRVVLER